MEIEKLKKDTGRVKSALKRLPDNSLIALESLSVYIPKRFEQSGLAEITEVVESILVLGIVVGNNYCLFSGIGRVILMPGEITEIVINNDKYIRLDFEPGDVVIKSLVIPIENSLGYNYYLEFTKYARIPWYVTEEDLLSMYDESEYYTGKPMGNSNQAMRVLYSLLNRDAKDLDIPFRYSADINNFDIRPKVIGVNNPGQLLNSTFSRLISGYLGDNIISGILNPDTKVTDLEEIYRGLPDVRD